MIPSSERWRRVPNWPTYKVSSHGRVIGPSGKLLKLTVNQDRGDYLHVNLTHAGDRLRIKVSALVLLAFVGPRPLGMHACHRNDISTDDRLENLRWDTPRENSLDIVRNGNHNEANKTHCSRGHLLAGDNLIPSKLPKRICIVCQRDRRRNRKASDEN